MSLNVGKLLLTIAPLIVISYLALLGNGQKANQPPCCKNWLGTLACEELYNTSRTAFNRSCNTDVDFSFIQCCLSCNDRASLGDSKPNPSNYTALAITYLINSTSCFDRRDTTFCNELLTQTAPWTAGVFTCTSSNLAFRVCRQTCGYCSTAGPLGFTYNADTATASCSPNPNAPVGKR